MKSFEYTIKDPVGMHARPGGKLVSLCAELDSKVSVKKGERVADGNRLFSLMSLAIKKDDTIVVIVEGGNEEENLKKLEVFFNENL